MSFLDKVTSIWQEDAKRYLHGWVQSDANTAAECSYVQVRCASMSLRFSKTNTASRTPVLQSSVRWPHRGDQITVSQTIDKTIFGSTDGPAFEVFEVADRALTGDLPLNGGDINVDIALLAAPGTSLFGQVTTFLSDVAELTMVPQLTTAAPIAEKIAAGVDNLLGNQEIQGILALVTSIPADAPRTGFYVVTDLPADQESLERLYVKAGQLYRHNGQQWQPASGFSHLVLEIRPKGSQPNRWKELPVISDLTQGALRQLTEARSVQAVRDAWPKMQQAIITASYTPDLAEVDRRLAAQAMTQEWKTEAQRLKDALGLDSTKAIAPGHAAAVAEAAETAGEELESTLRRILVGQITVQTEAEVEGEVVAGRITPDASVRAGDISVTTKGTVGPGGSVKGLDIG